MPDSGSYVLSVKVVVGSVGSVAEDGCCCCCCSGCDCLAGRAAFFSRYFWRFLIFEAVGFRTVYLEVMRVCLRKGFQRLARYN